MAGESDDWSGNAFLQMNLGFHAELGQADTQNLSAGALQTGTDLQLRLDEPPTG